MPKVCPACRERSLSHRAAMELPSDAHSDEITVQVLGCDRCGLPVISVYEESRRGAGDSWKRYFYENGPEDVAAVAAAIARCPAPSSKHCTCAEHQAFGVHDSDGAWKGLGKAGVNLFGGCQELPEGPDPFVGQYVLNLERSEFVSAPCPWSGATLLISNDRAWVIHILTRSYQDGSVRTLTNRVRLDHGGHAATSWTGTDPVRMVAYRVSPDLLRQIEDQGNKTVGRNDFMLSPDRKRLSVTHFVFDGREHVAVSTEVFDRVPGGV